MVCLLREIRDALDSNQHVLLRCAGLEPPTPPESVKRKGTYKAAWKREFIFPWRKADLLKSSRTSKGVSLGVGGCLPREVRDALDSDQHVLLRRTGLDHPEQHHRHTILLIWSLSFNNFQLEGTVYSFQCTWKSSDAPALTIRNNTIAIPSS